MIVGVGVIGTIIVGILYNISNMISGDTKDKIGSGFVVVLSVLALIFIIGNKSGNNFSRFVKKLLKSR